MLRHALFPSLILLGAVAALVLLATGRLSSTSGDPRPAETAAAGRDRAQGRPLRLFGPESVWNSALPDQAPLDSSSAEVVARLDREVEDELGKGVGPWITTSTCSTPIYMVSARQEPVPVRLTDPHEPWRAGLARAFRRVPLPLGARPAECSDAPLTVWQPASNTLWEFFHLRREGGAWRADWGGAIRAVSHSPGFYDARSWPGLSGFHWGATATSLPVAAGVMRIAELRRNRIEHALAMNVPTARPGVFAWPAQRSDGIGSSADIPEGAHFRLDPSLDLASLDLPPLTLAMAEAAQRYGIIVRDQTGVGNGISFSGQAARPAGEAPYTRPGGFYGGLTPSQLLADFPWADLQLLRMKLCRAGPCHR